MSNLCSCEKKAWVFFFRLSFRNCTSCVYNCDMIFLQIFFCEEQFVHPAEDLHCIICFLPSKEPVLTRCDHRFCGQCLEEHILDFLYWGLYWFRFLFLMAWQPVKQNQPWRNQMIWTGHGCFRRTRNSKKTTQKHLLTRYVRSNGCFIVGIFNTVLSNSRQNSWAQLFDWRRLALTESY